jgi:nitrate reductase NapE component
LAAWLAQGEDPDYAWTVTVIGFWLKLLAGLVGAVLSVAWMLQVHTSPP